MLRPYYRCLSGRATMLHSSTNQLAPKKCNQFGLHNQIPKPVSCLVHLLTLFGEKAIHPTAIKYYSLLKLIRCRS